VKNYSVVGKRLPRYDGTQKAVGAPCFTSDVSLPGMLYAKVLRSPYPHARIVNIDTTKAEQLPGVAAVICHKNTTSKLFNTSATIVFTLPPLVPVKDQRIFDDVVRYVGDEVAAVAAETEEIAQEALKLIEVEYEQLPSVFDPKEANKEEAPDLQGPREHGKNLPGEKIHLELGDIQKGFEDADYIFEHEFKLPVQKQCQMETMAAVATIDADGKITVYSSTQTVHPSRAILADLFDVPYSKVRVLSPPFIGGGFGVRIGLSAKAEPIAIALAQKAKRPVKVVYDREEDFTSSDTRHSGYVYLKTGVKKDGTFTARMMKAVLNAGAYCSFSTETHGVLGCMGLSLYSCPNQYYDGIAVYTNTTPSGAMRGFGSPQASTAIEAQLDIIAEELGIDRREISKKNMMKVGGEWVLPYQCQSIALEECIDQGAAAIGWDKKGTFDNSGSVKRGIGMACGTHVSNAWPFCGDYSNAYVNIQQDGSVQIAVGSPEMGTGVQTTLSQMVSETLGVTMDKIEVTIADTESSPFEIGAHASRTCYVVGMAVTQAAAQVKKEALEFAAKLLAERESCIYCAQDVQDLDIVDNMIVSKSNPNKKISLREVTIQAQFKGEQFIGVAKVVPQNAPPWLAHFADVSVDTETGKVTVNKLVAAHDVGRAINPTIVEGQIEGGLAQGYGYALTEEILYDENGRQLNTGFHKYMLPTAVDLPELQAIIVESDEPTHPFNVKGVGETGLIATAAAIMNAVYDAIGVRFFEIPMTEEKIYMALQESLKSCE